MEKTIASKRKPGLRSRVSVIEGEAMFQVIWILKNSHRVLFIFP